MLALLTAALALLAPSGVAADTIRVPLTVEAGLGPFAPFQGLLRPADGAVPPGFEAAHTLTVQDGSPAGVSVRFASARAADGDLRVVADTDGDGDLADETPFRLAPGWDATVHMATGPADAVRRATVALRLVVQPGDDEPTVWADEHRAGRFEAGGLAVRVVARAFAFPGPALTAETAEFVFAVGADPLAAPSASAPPYHVGERVALGGRAYELAAVTDGELVLVDVGPESLAESSRPGAVAPAIDAEAVGGGAVRLADLRGRPVVLDFWGTWCAPCVAALPALAALAEAFGDELAVVGIANDDAETVASFVAARGVGWPQVAGEAGQSVAERYGISAYPTAVVVGPDGRVLLRAEGDRAHPDRLAETLTGVLGPDGAARYAAYARAGNAAVSVAFPDAEAVAVAASFTEWGAVPMLPDGAGAWGRAFHLAPGRYPYKLIVDGEWVLDPANPDTESDGDGHVNSVLTVE